jgi:heptosyltransferase-1
MPDARDAAPIFSLPQGAPELPLPSGEFVLTSPAAGWMSKQWPAEHFVALGERLWRECHMPLVVDCAPKEVDLARSIVDRAQPGSCVLHPSSLAGLIAATRRARAVIGVDSGPLHLAAALNIPGVAIYGPTDPARNGPFGKSFQVLRQPGTPASYQRDAQIHPSMAAIGPEEVWPALKAKLAPERTPVQR